MASTNLTSTHWGTYRFKTHQGKLVELVPFEQDGDPADIGQGMLGLLDDRMRITRPMIRAGWRTGRTGRRHNERRGKDAFVAVSWDEAIECVAGELRRVADEHGNEAIYAGSYGWASAGRFHHAQSQLHRFMNMIGGCTRSVNTYSFAAAEVMVPHIIGSFRSYIYNQTSWQSIIHNTELFVAFGGVPLKNGQIGQGGLGRHIQREAVISAYRNGVEFVSISPLRDDMPAEAKADWLAIRPNTDTAFILGICRVLLEERLHSTRFLERYTTGFEKFAAYLCGNTDGVAKTADWAAEICSVPADVIRRLAKKMASRRTMISLSWSLSRQAHGEQPYWAGITLAAMLGQIGLAGGGFGLGYSAVNSVGNNIGHIAVKAMPQGENPVKSFIPVARVADMLLNPGKEFTYNGKDYVFPDIKLIYWAGGNPFHHHQDLLRLQKAWQKPDTVIIHEWCWNASAKHADIVLPATTPLERMDIAMSPLDNYFVSMERAVPPTGQAKDDYDILTELSRNMGCESAFTEDRTAAQWQCWLYENTRQSLAKHGYEIPSFSKFREKGWLKLKESEKPKIMLSEFRAAPEINKLSTPSGKIEIYSETIAEFGYMSCPPHASWLEPPEWLGNKTNANQLHLLCCQPKTKLHSQLDHGKISKKAKISDREPVLINRQDAARLNIKDGDLVRIFNRRGACLCGASVSNNIMSGVIMISTGAWLDLDYEGKTGIDCKHGNPNVLTPDRRTSLLSQGPAAHSCLVEIEVWKREPVPIRAFEPPVVIEEKNKDIFKKQ